MPGSLLMMPSITLLECEMNLFLPIHSTDEESKVVEKVQQQRGKGREGEGGREGERGEWARQRRWKEGGREGRLGRGGEGQEGC